MDDETRNTDDKQRTMTVLPPASVPPPPAGGTGWSAPAKDEPANPEPWADNSEPPPPAPETEPAAPAPKKRRGPLLLAGLAIGAILGGGAGAGVATVLDDDEATAPATRSSLDTESDDGGAENQQTSAASGVQAVADQVLPSVVSIAVSSQLGAGSGSGAVISSDGEIMTNNHVVAPAAQGGTIQVTFSDGATAEAEIIGTDPLTDLAVIKAQNVSGLTPAELGSSGDLDVGQAVVAVGAPLGLEGTVTSGIVSAMDRPVGLGERPGEQTVINAVQTDASINPGNSGGPLVNMDGQVVGINSAIATTGATSGSIGLGFAIPIDQVKPIVEQLLEGQQATHAQIGVRVGVAQDGTQGALIASVDQGSAAEEAGLQEGDIVTAIDDRQINDHIALIAAVRTYRPGDEVTLTYLRDGEERTAELTLGSDAQGT